MRNMLLFPLSINNSRRTRSTVKYFEERGVTIFYETLYFSHIRNIALLIPWLRELNFKLLITPMNLLCYYWYGTNNKYLSGTTSPCL